MLEHRPYKTPARGDSVTGRAEPRGDLGVDTVYRNPLNPKDASFGHREGIQHGITIGGINVIIIATRDAYYDHRKWGYDAGLWEHSYCLDADTMLEMIVSYHAASQQEKIETVITAVDWWRQVPACMRDEH